MESKHRVHLCGCLILQAASPAPVNELDLKFVTATEACSGSGLGTIHFKKHPLEPSEKQVDVERSEHACSCKDE